MGIHLSTSACSNQGRLLLAAATEGRLSDVNKILEDEPGLALYCKPVLGVNPLQVAAAAGRADVVKALLAALECILQIKSAKHAQRAKLKVLNQRNTHGQTPLMLASKAGSPACVRALLRAGADPTLFDGLSQSTCLHYAARFGWPEVIDVLLGDESLWAAAAGGGQRMLLREAVLVDSQGHHKYIDGRAALGLAPLHLSAAHGHLAATRALIKWGASLTVRCNLFLEDGQGPWVPCSTPLHLAAAKGDYSTILLLLTGVAQQVQQQGTAPGPDPRTLRDFSDRRPVEVAHAMGHASVLHLLSPATPLPQVVRPPTPTVPRLASLAAAALRQQLSMQLDHLTAQQAGHAQQELGKGQAGKGERSMACASHPQPEAKCCPICLEDGPLTAPAPDTAAASVAAEPAHWQMVAAAGCGHSLCIACAQELCSAAAAAGSPVKCPLCRWVVAGWV